MEDSAQTSRYKSGPSFVSLLLRMVSWLMSWLIGITLLLGAVAWHYEDTYQGRVFEGVSVNGVALGGLTAAQATTVLHERLPVENDERLVLHVGNESWVATMADLGIQLDVPAMAQKAFDKGRSGLFIEQWTTRFGLWQGTYSNEHIDPIYTQDMRAIDQLVARIANQVARDPQDAVLTVQGLSVSGLPAYPGRQLDVVASRERVVEALTKNERHVELVVNQRQPHIIGAEEAAQKARALLSKPLLLYFEQPEYRKVGQKYEATSQRRQWIVERARLAEMLQIFSNPLDSGQYAFGVRLKAEMLKQELAMLAEAIARDPREARFDYNLNTKTLTPMIISQEGLRLKVDESFASIKQAINEGQHEIALTVTTIPPNVATSDMDKMNIGALAVSGLSDYTGSSEEREVNLSIAASRYQGVVIPPGSIFSFNEHLGWVVDATGYEEGYIISGNRTEVDVGGGVCQVSTTLFRTAFNAGFEIVERQPHAYRVPYYENGSPLGFDATVFSPVVDLKFRNDTPNYYIVGVINNREANTLQMNLYGPPTGRQVELVSETVKTLPHGEPIYEEDPALPAGETKQVDWAHPGATIVLRRVVRDSTTGQEMRRDEFWSQYRPWQARYLVGTGGQ
ncbi:MAG: VanW family protein [Ardenticatenaceae bacterium]